MSAQTETSARRGPGGSPGRGGAPRRRRRASASTSATAAATSRTSSTSQKVVDAAALAARRRGRQDQHVHVLGPRAERRSSRTSRTRGSTGSSSPPARRSCTRRPSGRCSSAAGSTRTCYEQANIREQVSWATDDPATATAKATSLVAAAVAKAVAPAPAGADPRRHHAAGRRGRRRRRRPARRLRPRPRRHRGRARRARRDAGRQRLACSTASSPTRSPPPTSSPGWSTRCWRSRGSRSTPRPTVERVGGYVGNFTATVRQALTGVVIDAAARGERRGDRPLRPFEGYVLDAARPRGGPPARGRRRGATSRARRGCRRRRRRGEPTTTAVEIEAGAVVVATGFDHYVPAQGRVRLRAHPAGGHAARLHPAGCSAVEPATGLPELDGSPVARRRLHPLRRQPAGRGRQQAAGRTASINEYCSRVCCTATLQAICDLQEKRPDVATYDFYQDIRAYGRGHEEYYERASKGGTVFVRWNDQEPPTVAKAKPGDGAAALVRARGRPHLGRRGRGRGRPRRAGRGHAAGRRLRARREPEAPGRRRPLPAGGPSQAAAGGARGQRRARGRHQPGPQGHHGGRRLGLGGGRQGHGAALDRPRRARSVRGPRRRHALRGPRRSASPSARTRAPSSCTSTPTAAGGRS